MTCVDPVSSGGFNSNVFWQHNFNLQLIVQMGENVRTNILRRPISVYPALKKVGHYRPSWQTPLNSDFSRGRTPYQYSLGYTVV